jgi:hypothetical protein
VKAVQHFKANDGTLFEDEAECAKYDEVLGARDKAVALILPKQFDTTDFANGTGYIQLTEDTKDDFIDAYLGLVKRLHPSLHQKAVTNPVGIIGRYLCDSDSPLYRLWTLACQIDKQNRLWGQPYYALHPDEGTQTLLTRR